MREVLAQLGLKQEGHPDVAQPRLGLGLPDPQATAVEVQPRAGRTCQLRDPWAREAERREQRATPVLLMRRQLALPLAGDVEEIDDPDPARGTCAATSPPSSGDDARARG
jgi:hypothetical protein